jgi:hypothetical protein
MAVAVDVRRLDLLAFKRPPGQPATPLGAADTLPIGQGAVFILFLHLSRHGEPSSGLRA